MNSHSKVHGGIVFEPMAFGSIEQMPLPDKLTITISGTPTVKVGESVLKGQALTKDDGYNVLSHASTSGLITEVKDNHITISADKKDLAIEPTECNPSAFNESEWKDFLRLHGLLGLGGAAFPVADKVSAVTSTNKRIDTLLINAAECDPWIYCDEALIETRSADIIKGIESAIAATGASNCIIGIEENKARALESLNEHLTRHIKIKTVANTYPSGAENKLFSLCTGKTSSLHANNAICMNVGTCYAIYRAVELAEPLISRVVTVMTNEKVHNLELRMGTSINAIADHLNLAGELQAQKGGRMMGAIIPLDASVDAQTNSITFSTNTQSEAQARPCIRCGDCASVCPEQLLPQQLYWFANSDDIESLQQHELSACIECGCCDEVCPSHIPLTSIFQQAKQDTETAALKTYQAQLAKQRFEKRQLRLEQTSVKNRETLDEKTDKLTTRTSGASKQDLIKQALARKKNHNSTNKNN